MESSLVNRRRRWLDRQLPGGAIVKMALAWCVVTLASSLPAKAAELVTAQLTSGNDSYSIRTEVLLTGAPAQVREALVEYRRLPSLNPNIEHVMPLPDADDGGLRLKLHARACFLMICQRYEWVQRVEYLPDGQIFAIVEPVSSDFRSGWFRYRFLPHGDRCRLILDAQLTPKDGISRNRIMRAVMKQVLADEAVTLARRLEASLLTVSAKSQEQRGDWAG